MQVIRLNTLAAFVLTALAPVAVAQNVVFTNSNNATTNQPYTIPIGGSQPVTIAPNGDVRLPCVLDGSTGRCSGFPTGGGGPVNPNAPTVGMSASVTDSDPNTAGIQVPAGTQFTINVSPSNNALACLRSVSPSIGTWDAVRYPSQASETLSLPAAGNSYTFDAKCFNDAGSGSASPITLIAVQGSGGGGDPPPPTGCSPANDGFWPPASPYTGASGTLVSLWGFAASVVDDVGKPLTTTSSVYRPLSFTRAVFSTMTNSFAINTAGPSSGRAADVYVSISTCPGDFRPPVSATTPGIESHRTAACRKWMNQIGTQGTIVWQSNPTPSQFGCFLDPAKTYYFNVALDDPTGGLDPTSPGECTTSNCGLRLSFKDQ